MPNFTTRVELHAATAKDYEKLHEAMKKKGFKRTIEGGKGVVYHLPTAEYNYETSSDLSASDVNDKAKSAAESVYDGFSILTTKSSGRSWFNLDEV